MRTPIHITRTRTRGLSSPLAVLVALVAATLLATLVVAYAITATPASASASIGIDTSVGTAAPPPTLGGYTMTPFAPDSRSEYGIVTDVTAPGGGTLQFDRGLSHRRVGSSWGSWSHGYAGDVYTNFFNEYNYSSQVVMTLPANTKAFYFYVEPNWYDEISPVYFNVTATAHDGTTSGPIAVQGYYGAQYFGFYSKDGAALSTINVSIDNSNAYGFAVGEFAIGNVRVDTLKPTVTAVTPTGSGVSRGTNVTATFSEAMQAATVKSNFKLYRKGSTTPISATVRYDAATKKATLNPYGSTTTTKLARGTIYKAVVGSGAKDLAGNNLRDQNSNLSGVQPKVWYFTTRS